MFSVGLTPGTPVTLCPDHCYNECTENCPKNCCNAFCPRICASHCLGSCPVRCCRLKTPGLNGTNTSLTKPSKLQKVKDFLLDFCSAKCNNICDASCPPVCCHGKSLFFPAGKIESVGKQEKQGSKNSMNWSEMIKFLNNLFHTYGTLNKSKAIFESLKIPLANKNKTMDSPKPKLVNKTLSLKPSFKQPQPVVITDELPAEHFKPKVFQMPTVAQPTPVFLNEDHQPPNHNPLPPAATKPLRITKPNTFPLPAPPQKGKLLPDNSGKPLCPSICKDHCYQECQVSCCSSEGLKSLQSETLPPPETTQKDGYRVTPPHVPAPGFIASVQSPTSKLASLPNPVLRPVAPFAPSSAPASQALLSSAPRISQPLAAPTQRLWNAAQTPRCPANCPQECSPGCTYRCCVAGSSYQLSGYQLKDSNTDPYLNVRGSPQEATCPSGCSKACYPSCSRSCCQANKESDSSNHFSFSVKIPCAPSCRPFRCLAYCHHDCCLSPNQKRTMSHARHKGAKTSV